MRYLGFSLSVLATLLLAGCVQQPNAPLVQGVVSKKAIEIKYVGVPHMDVHIRAFDDAPIVSTYSFGETAAVLENKGDWSMIRTYNGGGAWVHSKDLITVAELKAYLDDPKPRFYIAPATVPPMGRAHGTIALLAKVNTDGQIYDVTTVQNTTGNKQLEEANINALKAATFYPLIQKGNLRAAFNYDYKVQY